jgi:hypothetical protein
MQSGYIRSGTGRNRFVGTSSFALAALVVVNAVYGNCFAADPCDARVFAHVTGMPYDTDAYKAGGCPLLIDRLGEGYCSREDSPDRGYEIEDGTLTADFVARGYIVDFAPRAKRSVAQPGQMSPAVDAVDSGGKAQTAPLPAAVFMFPLGAAVAVYMGRKFR